MLESLVPNIMHAVVPGLERFMLITDGNLVLPGPRGQAAAGDRGFSE